MRYRGMPKPAAGTGTTNPNWPEVELGHDPPGHLSGWSGVQPNITTHTMDVILHGFPAHLQRELESTARDKGAKLEALLPGTVESRCEIHRRHRLGPERACRVQLTMHVRKRILRSEVKGPDAQAALDAAVHKMERQIERFKGRRRHVRRMSKEEARQFVETVPPVSEDYEDVGDGLIVREKEFTVQPMAVADAVETMEQLNHDFHLFKDQDSGAIHVVYRRHNGNYGLLRPRDG